MGHGIGVFGGVGFQPGALGVLFQEALAFETVTDQLNQVFQLTIVRRLNALKAGRTIVATHVDSAQKQDMEVDIHVQCTTKTLNQRYGPGRAIHKRISSLMDQMGRKCPVNDTQNLVHWLRMGGHRNFNLLDTPGIMLIAKHHKE